MVSCPLPGAALCVRVKPVTATPRGSGWSSRPGGASGFPPRRPAAAAVRPRRQHVRRGAQPSRPRHAAHTATGRAADYAPVRRVARGGGADLRRACLGNVHLSGIRCARLAGARFHTKSVKWRRRDGLEFEWDGEGSSGVGAAVPLLARAHHTRCVCIQRHVSPGEFEFQRRFRGYTAADRSCRLRNYE